MITVAGHGDFRQLSELPRSIGGMLSRMEQIGGSMVADSPDEVRVRVREQLMQGASQIKLTAGGGVSSPFSPIDVSTFTEPELRAAVEAAENWGTYVTVHAFTPMAIQRAIAAGVKCIEHGFLMDDATAKLIAEKGIWLSLQPLPEELRQQLSRQAQCNEPRLMRLPGIARTYELAKYKIKTAWGSDVLFSQALAQQLECARDGGQFAGWELTEALPGFQRMKAMARHRIHKHRVQNDRSPWTFIAGETTPRSRQTPRHLAQPDPGLG